MFYYSIKYELTDIVVNKNKFHASIQAIVLNSVKTGKILDSYKFKLSNDGYKYFIGCLYDDDVITPLSIILTQIREYTKHFDNGGKNISFKIEDESPYLKQTFSSMINTLAQIVNFQKKKIATFVLQHFVLILY